MLLKGIDVSSYDVKMDWSKYDWDFCFVKVSEGMYADPMFKYHWTGAKGHTLRSAYHFFRPSVDPKLSAQATVNLLGSDLGELPLMFDMEDTDGRTDTLVRAKSWLSWYEQFTHTRPIIYSSVGFLDDLKISQATWLSNYKLHLAQYRYENLPVDTRTKTLHQILTGEIGYTFPALYAPFKRMAFVQWTAKGAPADVPGYYVGTGGKLAVDLNFYNGTREQFLDEFGVTSAPPAIEHTQPYAGVDEYIEIVNGERCHITLIPLSVVKEVRVKHFNGALGYVSQSQAQIAFNGDDYDKKLPAPHKPYSLSYVDGVSYTPQRDFRKWLNIRKDKTLQFGHKDLLNPWMVTSFVRPLVLDGVINPTITDPAHADDIENKEIHARAGLGYRPDGTLIQIVAEGHVVPETGIADRGVTLLQFAALFKKYDAFTAGEHGGGGDMGKKIAGKMVNAPSDPTERAVVQVIEIYLESTTGEIPMTMYTVKAKTDGVKVYKNADGTSQIASLNMSDTAKADAIAGELIHVTSKNGNPLSGYVFLSKVNYTADAVTPPPPPPPDPTTPSVFITHDFSDTLTIDGKVYTANFTVPNVEYKPQA